MSYFSSYIHCILHMAISDIFSNCSYNYLKDFILKDLVQVKHPPVYFVKTINSYLDYSLAGKKFRKRVNHSTRVLRDLEISLRTNHIG